MKYDNIECNFLQENLKGDFYMPKNEIKVFSNDELELQVRTILNEDGSISVNAEDTAIGFGWFKVENKNGKNYTSIRWNRMNEFSKEIGFDHLWAKGDYVPESLYYLLGMKANNEKAQKYQKWLAIEVLPALRKTGHYEMAQKEPIPEPAKNDSISAADCIKVLELITNCPAHAIQYAANIAQPFMETKDKPQPEVQKEPVILKPTKPPKPRICSAGYTTPFNLERLKRHIAKIGWTHIELARRSGIDTGLVLHYLKGENSPSTESRQRMCQALGKSLDWLDMR